MDYISRYNNIPGRRIIFDADTEGFVEIPSVVTNESIMIDMSIKGHRTKVFLNTANSTSFVDKEFTNGLEPYYYTEEFHPSVGKFTTPLFEVRVRFAGRRVTLCLGNLPAKVQRTMNACGGHGTLGVELIDETPVLISGGKVFVKE